ncbi:MAG: CRISPR-associated endonuclease Cas2 [Bacteroidota bacterium]
MNYLIAYDISNNRIRLKIAQLLRRAGLHRVQRSVFIGEMRDPVANKLEVQLKDLSLKPEWEQNDHILILPLHQYSEDHQRTIGSVIYDWNLIYQKNHTLVL